MIFPSPNEITRSLWGALRLLRRDPDGLQDFNMTEQGFWRSFFAVAIAAPMWLFMDFALYETGADYTVARAGRYVASIVFECLAFVLLMFYFTRWRGLAQRFRQLVITLNWCGVVASVLMLVPALFYYAFKRDQEDVAALYVVLLAVPLFIVVVVYYWFVIRVALQTSGGVTASVLAIWIFLGILIQGMLGLL